MSTVSLIAAVARNGVIGGQNRLLWRLKSDLRRFRTLTMGKPLIMGRKTWESIGGPLPGRRIIVVTREPGFAAHGVERAASPQEALDRARDIAGPGGDIMIGGGGEIYAALLPQAQRLFLTRVGLAPQGDTLFPPVEPSEWREVRREEGRRGPEDEAAFTFIDYVRRDG